MIAKNEFADSLESHGLAIGELNSDRPLGYLHLLPGQLSKIQRFQDTNYPEGAFVDDVRSHVRRCVLRVRSVDLQFLSLAKLERILWIHDVGEIAAGEVTAIIKSEDPALGGNLKSIETEFAQRLLSEQDIQLYQDFEYANGYLKGNNDGALLDGESLVAAILDKCDGNMFFHFYLARWCTSSDYNSFDLPRESALTYTFQQYSKFSNRLRITSKIQPEIRKICSTLLDQQIDFIKNIWSDIDDHIVPAAIKRYLD